MSGICKMDGCTNPIRQKGMCNMHRLRLARHGDASIALKPRKKPGEVRLNGGYLLGCNNVAIHRQVAEQMLGRTLRPGEVVHHIDGDRANNAPENLRVFPSQSEHMAHHEELRRQLRKKA